MAIAPVFFNGKNSDIIWGKSSQYQGSRFYVPGFAPSILTGTDRTMRLGTGVALGYGIGGINDANVDVQMAAIGAATFHWTTVVLRCNRSAKTAVLTKVKATDNTDAISVAPDGTASLVFPSGVKFAEADRDAGEWDIPIAMGKVTATSANLAELLDIRPHDALWPHTFADPPPGWWTYGALVTVDRAGGQYEVWQRRGTTVWANLTNPAPLASPGVAWQSGWADSSSRFYASRNGRPEADMQFTRSGAQVTPDTASGNVNDVRVAVLPAPFLAPTGRYIPAFGIFSTSSGLTGGFGAYLNDAGEVWIATSVNVAVPWPTNTRFHLRIVAG